MGKMFKAYPFASEDVKSIGQALQELPDFMNRIKRLVNEWSVSSDVDSIVVNPDCGNTLFPSGGGGYTASRAQPFGIQGINGDVLTVAAGVVDHHPQKFWSGTVGTTVDITFTGGSDTAPQYAYFEYTHNSGVTIITSATANPPVDSDGVTRIWIFRGYLNESGILTPAPVTSVGWQGIFPMSSVFGDAR